MGLDALGGHVRNSTDEHLFYFRGGLSGNSLRQELVSKYRNQPRYLISTDPKDITEVIEEYTASTFCAAPPGSAPWSFRLTESIIAGCIPVILDADEQVLPFEKSGLRWSNFAIMMNRTDIDSLDTRIQDAISRIPQMRAELSNAAKAFKFSGAVALELLTNELRRALAQGTAAAAAA